MKKTIAIITLALGFFTYSCDIIDNAIDNLPEDLSKDEVVEGLKTALEIGTDTATSFLGVTDGYYGNLDVRIPLPKEVEDAFALLKTNEEVYSLANSLFSLQNKFDNVVLAVNRAAENAATEAGPIFKDAITGMDINEAWNILNGEVPTSGSAMLKSNTESLFDSTAATQYFKNNTYIDLTSLYSPKINSALDIKISGIDISAVDAWGQLTSSYNSFMSNFAVKTAISFSSLNGKLPASFNNDLGAFCTEKALNGLFSRVEVEEIKIRRDPFQWASDIIRKVFNFKDDSAGV